MTVSRDPNEEHIHVHVERERTVEPVVEQPIVDPYSAEHERAASFFTMQVLWVVLIVLLVVALIALLASGTIDIGGTDNVVDPTAVP